MVQGPSAAALEALRDASASIDEQVALLRQLKNDIVGHQQRKELVVKEAAVEPLVRVVSRVGGSHALSDTTWSQHDEARLQATLVLGSLAGGGAAFMRPLLAANVPNCLLSTLPATQHPKQLTATLQALRTLAQLSQANVRADAHPRVDIIDDRMLALLESIIRKRTHSLQFAQLFRLATDIIIAATVGEHTRDRLLDSRVWSPLLNLYATALFKDTPGPQAALPLAIAAINAIIDGSHYRTECFIHDPAVCAAAASESGLQHLPQIHVPPVKNSISFATTSASFPALASLQSNSSAGTATVGSNLASPASALNAHRVCMHVLSLATSLSGPARLHALRLLASINNAIDAHQLLGLERVSNQHRLRLRERYISMCAVPMAVRLVQTACENASIDNVSALEQKAHHDLKPESCDVLGRLASNNKELQVAAVDSGAIKRLSPILKKSFDGITSTKPMWSAHPSNPEEDAALPETCRLGGRGMPAELDYAMRCRRGALEAIAALTSRDDIHKQAIVQAGVVPCIIDSLKPFPPEVIDKLESNGHQVSPKDGNTTSVIIAACHAAKTMSRSVSLLRTSLIDAGIAKPVFDLLKHPVSDVRNAATEVCCNLVLEFSPMKEDLLHAGVIKTLVEQARQNEMPLRVNSMWALKHIVLYGTRDVKMQALEELGVGWLVAAVQGQHRPEIVEVAGGGVSINAAGGLSAPNAAGERVDLLNPSSMDVDNPPASRDYDEEDGEVLYDESSSTHYRASNLRTTLSTSSLQPPFDPRKYLEALRNMERNEELRARRADVAVQEQGLDFLRNLLNGDDCAYMLEHLLNQIGTTQVFILLTEKLTPLNNSLQQHSSRVSNINTSLNRPIYHPTELILATVHVITHICNGSSQQKNLLVAQNPLLQAWLPHFSHPDRRVRCISVWAYNSLTWLQEEGDRHETRQRLQELRRVGIAAAVHGLKADEDLDVRERVRTAVRNGEQLG